MKTNYELKIALQAQDVVVRARTFKTLLSKFKTNTNARRVVSVLAVKNSANELYFAARSAWRLALAQERERETR